MYCTLNLFPLCSNYLVLGFLFRLVADFLINVNVISYIRVITAENLEICLFLKESFCLELSYLFPLCNYPGLSYPRESFREGL